MRLDSVSRRISSRPDKNLYLLMKILFFILSNAINLMRVLEDAPRSSRPDLFYFHREAAKRLWHSHS